MKQSKICKLIYLYPVILTCLYPILFLYFNNIGSVYFKEIIQSTVYITLISLLFTFFFTIINKSVLKGSVCSVITALFLLNFKYIERIIQVLIPQIKYWHVAAIVLFLLVNLFYFIRKSEGKDILSGLLKVVAIVMSGLLVFNFIIAIPKLLHKTTIDTNIVTSTNENNTVTEELPNIYYFIFDEYSSFDVLEKYYDYNNYPFAEFLENHKFTVSYNGYNDSQQTSTILANYMNLDYVAVDTDSINDRNQMVKSNYLFNIARSNGYEINSVIGGEFLGLSGKTNIVSTTISGEDFSTLIYKNTVIYPFLVNNTYVDAENYLKAFDLFANKSLYDEYPNNTFHMSYFSLPHQPFIFDEDGKEVLLSHTNDWVNKEYYLNQLIFTTKKIEQMLDNIIKQDPNSIIIVQSDHSARSLQDANGNYLIDKYDRRHFLNAIYFQGEPIDEIINKSGVNTLRLLFNRLFDLNFTELEVPISESEF